MVVYGVFSGCYSDWNVHGYFKTRDEAEKYCAIQNRKNIYDKYYVKNLPEITADVSDISLRYYHEVVFDFKRGMRNEPDRYEYYIGERKPSKTVYNVFPSGDGWIAFSFDCDKRDRAEKIAQDKYYIFMNYYKETGSYEIAAQTIGAIHR